QPFPHFTDDEAARLLRGQVGVVDHPRAERDHERRGRALAVPLIADGQVLLNAFRRAALDALIQRRVEVKLEPGLRANVPCDTAPFHDQVAELHALTLALD